MPISQAQIEEARGKVRVVQQFIFMINVILEKVTEAILTDEEGNIIVDLTANQKTQLLSEYAKAKTALIDAVEQLP